VLYFFFSSRRRHTRFSRDWSSDVCSSDLNFQVMIDFAHNPKGYMAIEDFLGNIDSPHKIGIIAGVGDRRDEDIKECGKIAGRMRSEERRVGKSVDVGDGRNIKEIKDMDVR